MERCSSMNKSLLFLSALTLVNIGCAEDKGFKGGVAKTQPKEAEVIKPEPTKAPFSEVFNLNTQQSELDIVWVIDNSGSMREEADQVRRNFDNFIDSVGEDTNLKLALISQTDTIFGPDTTVTLSDEHVANGHKQVNIPVGSTNALAITAAASCDASQTNIDFNSNDILAEIDGTSEICGLSEFSYSQDFIDRNFGRQAYYMESPGLIENAKGTLAGFFRPNATRAYVFVTDDNAHTVDQEVFLKMIKNNSPELEPIIYAFRGDTSTGTCSVANKGTAYENLSSQTKGEVFDICKDDWSEHFSTLSKSIVTKTNNKFTLKHSPIPGSLVVKVAGNEIDEASYELSGLNLTINESELGEADATVRVNYDYEKE
ncbi:MAG: VWA domain-containing protein [Pseudobacteriovorax sp.]|nr:VWA domain-containing protein [Pseudobacteriovorax sp.]